MESKEILFSLLFIAEYWNCFLIPLNASNIAKVYKPL
jgi:hypothetical protein